ncbi:MAG: hypothetical protein M3Z50_02155 [Actinomycetota bacterium]|nr:hypothetical protein [Actinomycetota bacterium]
MADNETDSTSPSENAPETDVLDSEPNADSAEGLAGGMGVSSERVGTMRGSEPGTNGAERTQAPAPIADPPPEQSSDPATGEPHPDPPVLKDHGPRSGA